jgi:two-component system CheB/CheR fusion protein
MKTENEDVVVPLERRADGFFIVGIGASAGGIQALREFFSNVPSNSGIAYVVILHLSPDHDSQLAEVLQLVSSIPVVQVLEKTKIEPDFVYVVPPNQHLIMQDGFITPSINIYVEERRAPVDIFFRNLADTYGPRSIGVVLSGTGANGSMGIKRIKEMGGVAYVQNPREAEFNEMPRNSIATELIDEILPVAEIPPRIIAYRNSVGSVQIVVEPEQRPEDQQLALREIFNLLRVRTGHDFTNYKRGSLLRRIERRINVRNLPDLPAYTTYMMENPEESVALLKDLLISVTNFFRDTKAFKALEQQVIPATIGKKKGNNEIKVWVAGCATGEEAYSLAMLYVERTFGTDAPKIQIFATDIDESAITAARDGFYTLNDAADVSPERLRRFFNKELDGYRVKREIRELVIFANHNLLKDPPFSRLDLITCRNLLIYLDSTAQERVMETFHFALKPGGFLFLGSSETADASSDLFMSYNRESHIYQAREVSARHYPVPQSIPNFKFKKADPLQKAEEKEASAKARISFGELHQRLLEQYAPPSVVINEQYDIVHMSNKVGKFFELPGGEPTQNLLTIIKPELRLEVRAALYQAVQRNLPVEATGLKLVSDGRTHVVDVHVRPVLNNSDTAKGFMLVVFNEKAELRDGETVRMSADEPVARQIEEELIHVKNQLRTSVEQYEFQAEELRASNEELQAMNEELRSATEELETSKEELQSINEELRTVNQELQVKIEETSVTSNNLQNLINSANVGTIFLDRSFCTRMFTPAVLKIFNLIPADYGRPISNITHKLKYDDLIKDAQTVLEKLSLVEREVATTDNCWYMVQILPYRTSEDRINGVVLTFVDITKRKEAEFALQQSEQHLRLLIESAEDYAIFTQDTNRRITGWNAGAELMMGYSEAEILGKAGDIIFTPEDRKKKAPEKEAETAIKEGRAINERWHVRQDGSRFWGSGSVSRIIDSDGNLIGLVKIMRDLTESKEAEERYRIRMEQEVAERTAELSEKTLELHRSNEDLQQFAHVASHDLKEPARKIKTFHNRIKEDFDGELPQKVHQYLEKINSATDRMYSMIDGILDYSKLKNSRPKFQPVNLNEIIKSIESDLEVLIQQKNASIQTNKLMIIHADRVLLYQLFYNLILNSLKFSKKDQPIVIQIVSEIMKQDEAELNKITLSDNGIGFEQEYASNIFDPFTRLNPADEYEGTGLGLALCKKIVERHEGSISATGKPDEGAKFTVLLPISLSTTTLKKR